MKSPLIGKRILITRAREQAADFTNQLKKLGAEVIEFPTIKIVPPTSWKRLDQAIDQLESYDWVIFTSVNGVNFFYQRLKEKRKKDALPPWIKVCAIGPATANQLKEKKIPVSYIPKEYIAEAILKGFEKMSLRGKRILLVRAKRARDLLPKGLKERGAEVDVVEAYRTVKPKGGGRQLRKILIEEKIDAIAFTSSSTVDHFVELLKGVDLKKTLKNIAIACIGPVTSRTAKGKGLNVQIQPHEYTIPGLSQALREYFLRKRDPHSLSKC